MGAMSMKNLTVSRKTGIQTAACCLILLLAFCIYRAFFCPLEENLTIGGLDVGGMTLREAHQLLQQELKESLYLQPLVVQLPEETLRIAPKSCGLKVNTGRLLLDAVHGKSDSTGTLSLRPYLSADETAIRSKLEQYAAKHDTELTQPSWRLEGEAQDLSTEFFSPEKTGQTLAVTLGTPAVHLNVEEVLEEILLAFSDAITLCRENDYQIAPVNPMEALPRSADAAAIARELETTPVNDAVDRSTLSLVHGSYGTTIDKNLLAEKFFHAAYGETVRIPIQYLPPEILGQEAYFRDVLGAYETRHTNNKNRNTNLQIQCDALNGLVLQPGETFSMNGVLGQRTTEKGYLPAPAYSGNRLVNSPGGGVCQGTTTLYNCVLLADLEVVFRACHGVKVGYVPLGLDAAVNFLTTDFQFRNNFHFPIQIRAWMEDEHVKMQILGIDEKDYYIKMETGSGEDDYAYYARSYKCKYDKETNELISREVEAYSIYYKSFDH